MRDKTKKSSKKGFTLIELMITVAIIGILVAIGSVMFARAQRTARDAVRKAALRQLATALEVYKTEVGTYPSTSGAWWGEPPAYGSHPRCDAPPIRGYIPYLCPNYFGPNLPRDPFRDPLDTTGNPFGFSFIYTANTTGSDYKILSYGTLESVNSVPTTDPFYDPTCVLAPTQGCGSQPGARCQSFAVYTYGGRCW